MIFGQFWGCLRGGCLKPCVCFAAGVLDLDLGLCGGGSCGGGCGVLDLWVIGAAPP